MYINKVFYLYNVYEFNKTNYILYLSNLKYF